MRQSASPFSAVPDRPPGPVYVWQIPVRLTHWVNALCIVVLCFTGYYIHNPYVQVSAREAYGLTFMGNMRAAHMIFAYIFIASILLRTYWAFYGGNEWASWKALVPFFTPEGRGKFKQSLQYYLFMRREPPTTMGHNPLAGFTYGIIVLLYFIQIFTGFALYGLGDPGGTIHAMTSWIFQYIDAQYIRMMHNFIMWWLIAFVIHHVYSAFLVDSEEANGLMTSIFSGWKFKCPERGYNILEDKEREGERDRDRDRKGSKPPGRWRPRR